MPEVYYITDGPGNPGRSQILLLVVVLTRQRLVDLRQAESFGLDSQLGLEPFDRLPRRWLSRVALEEMLPVKPFETVTER